MNIINSRDAHQYNQVKIGDQVWKAENLVFLPKIDSSSDESYTEPYYYFYGYKGTDITVAKATQVYKIYGVLYNWPAAKSACPEGWHLPTDEEWKQLGMAIGMSRNKADDSGSLKPKQIKLLKFISSNNHIQALHHNTPQCLPKQP